MNCTWTDARSVFLSDLHLGWKFSNSFHVAGLLRQCSPKFLYLVGDTFEWLYRPTSSLDEQTRFFLATLSYLQNNGTNIYFLPGNHDEVLAQESCHQAWSVVSHRIHQCSSGSRFLIVHGDIFDLHRGRESCSWKKLGRWVYPKLVQWGNTLSRIGFSPKNKELHWCTHWKMSSERAKNHMNEFQSYMVELAEVHDCDGVVCGHIHLPKAANTNKHFYFNCGDWIEHRSFVFECPHGNMFLVPDALNPTSNSNARCEADPIEFTHFKIAV